ncbi:unnamed protein product [Diatraea saccharalis]|uniref:DUF4604 domain-containing protein n=1 Tax=Diatraea saccharalis TaxID=40085 RepID=A0A9N9QY78_9NEOP|nr:unnamed protein product [Diatraea saccharalis]
MNRKRNVSFIRPDDPEFLKVLKKQAGYDVKNHKFDELQNAEEDFVNDEESEKPQVVVLNKGDLTAEEAEVEQKKIDNAESEIKADLTRRVIFKSKSSTQPQTTKRKKKESFTKDSKKIRPLLSFNDEDEDD